MMHWMLSYMSTYRTHLVGKSRGKVPEITSADIKYWSTATLASYNVGYGLRIVAMDVMT